MTISILQSAINASQYAGGRSDTTVAVTLPGVTAGSSIAVFVTVDRNYTATVSDGSAYTQRQTQDDTVNAQRTYLFTLDNASGGSHTITATFSPGAALWDAIQAFEIGGTLGYDKSASQLQAAPGTGTDGVSSTSVTPTNSGSLLLGWSQNQAGTGAPSAGTGYSLLNTDSTVHCAAEYVVQSSATSQAATFTAASNVAHATFLAVFSSSAPGQFARPTTDVSAGTWTQSTGGSIAACIDETPFSDADYASTTANGTCRVNLSSVSTPDTGTRTVRFRSGGSSAKKLIVSLIEGASTTVATTTIDPLPASPATQTFTVASAITNYGDLDLSFEVADATTAPTPSVTFGAIGTGANGGTSVLPSYPTGITAGDLLVATVTSGGSANPTPGTPSGWTSQGSYVTTDGTYGIDTGPRRVTVFTKTASGTETGTLSITITGGDSCRGSIMRVSKGQASYVWDIAATGGNYSANGTAVSVTGGAIGIAPGDLVIVSNSQRVDTATQSAQALAASGITFGTLTNRTSTAVTTGNDHRHVIDSRPVTAGTASVAPTWSYTASAACSAAIHFLRIREVPPTEFARVTFAEFEVPAAAGGSASAPGATLNAATSLISGPASAAASVSGATLTASASLLPGVPTVAATAPTATVAATVSVLPGAPTAGASIAGAILPATITLIPGTATAGATVSGAVLPVSATLIPGSASAGASATAPGAALTAATALIPGVATAGAAVAGAVLPVSATLIPGSASAGASAAAPGAALTAATALIPGVATAGATVSGALLSVVATVRPGAANDSAGAPPHTDYAAAPAARDFAASRRGRTWATTKERDFTASSTHRRTGT